MAKKDYDPLVVTQAKTIDPKPVNTSVNLPPFEKLQIPYDSLDPVTGTRYTETTAETPFVGSGLTNTKTIRLEITGPAMTDKRYSQYTGFAIDGVVKSTITDNGKPTITQMEALVKGYHRFQRLCMILSSVGATVTMLPDYTDDITVVDTTYELDITYTPSRLPVTTPTTDLSAEKPVELNSAVILSATRPTTSKATIDEIRSICNLIWEAVSRIRDVKGKSIEQTWLDTTIVSVPQAVAEDNTSSKAYNVVQLTTKQYTLDGYMDSINVTEKQVL